MIRQWAVQHPGCNWALATGHQSGLFVLDVDGEPGRAELAALEAKQGRCPSLSRLSLGGTAAASTDGLTTRLGARFAIARENLAKVWTVEGTAAM